MIATRIRNRITTTINKSNSILHMNSDDGNSNGDNRNNGRNKKEECSTIDGSVRLAKEEEGSKDDTKESLLSPLSKPPPYIAIITEPDACDDESRMETTYRAIAEAISTNK